MDTELQVGRELDAAVAKALGKTIRQWGDELGDNDLVLFGGNIVRCDPTYESLVAWMPSTSIADAFAALDAVLAKHAEWDPELIRSWYKSVRQWECALAKQGETVAWGRGATPAEAICRAILDLEATGGH